MKKLDWSVWRLKFYIGIQSLRSLATDYYQSPNFGNVLKWRYYAHVCAHLIIQDQKLCSQNGELAIKRRVPKQRFPPYLLYIQICLLVNQVPGGVDLS